jgi:hypothetical protein
MAGSSTIDRRNGIPGSDAVEQIEQMGGPIARRASRVQENGSGRVLDAIQFRHRSPQRPSSDVSDDNENATAVLPETDIDADDDQEEWKPVRYPRSEVRRRVAEQNARPSQAAPERARKNAPARRRTDDLPKQRQRRRLHGGVILLLGALALIALYLIIGWLYIAGVGISNHLSYGPTPTFHLGAVVGDNDSPAHPTHFTAMNVHGTIVIQVAPGGDFVKSSTYVLTSLDPHVWGNVDDVIVTLQVQGSGPTPNVVVQLQGDPDLSHFLVRPGASILLLNQKPGFKAGPNVLQ